MKRPERMMRCGLLGDVAKAFEALAQLEAQHAIAVKPGDLHAEIVEELRYAREARKTIWLLDRLADALDRLQWHELSPETRARLRGEADRDLGLLKRHRRRT